MGNKMSRPFRTSDAIMYLVNLGVDAKRFQDTELIMVRFRKVRKYATVQRRLTGLETVTIGDNPCVRLLDYADARGLVNRIMEEEACILKK